MKKKNSKIWTEDEEMELNYLYSSAHLTYKELAEHFRCTQGEVKKKVKEMGIIQ